MTAMSSFTVNHTSLSAELITTLDELRRLRGDWNQLVEEAELSFSWYRQEWLDLWWQAFGRDHEMFVVVLKEGDSAVAAAPLMVVGEKRKGVRIRTLKFMENGITPRSQFIVADNTSQLHRRLWEAIISHRSDWDVAILANIPVCEEPQVSTPGTLEGLEARFLEQPDRRSPYIDLTPGYETWRKSTSYSHRRNITTAQNRLSRLGPISVRSAPGDLAYGEALDICLEISRQSWKAQSGSDLGGHPAQRLFYEKLFSDPVLSKLLHVWVLYVGDRPTSFEILIRSGSTLTGLATDYDQEYRHGSPGVVLRDQLLQQAAQLGITEYDLAGQAYDHKMHWTKLVRPHSQVWVFHSGVKSRLLYSMKAYLLPAVKRFRRSVQREEGRVARSSSMERDRVSTRHASSYVPVP
jgi:CelD/BcsL family acetyltransferase involved in cellulose biosynthesis